MISDEAKRSLVQIIRRTFDEWIGSAETVEAWASRLERAIATHISAPAVPAEIVKRARRLPIYPTTDALSKWLNDPHALDWHDRNAAVEAIAIARDLAAQPAPAPDPEAMELAKRLPNNGRIAAALMTQDQCDALSAAAAFVRRAAGEPGA